MPNKPKGPDVPVLYNAGLFKKSKRNTAFRYHGERFQDIAGATGLAINTVQDAFNGKAAKLATLKTLADYYEIDWTRLFDVGNRLSTNPETLAADFAEFYKAYMKAATVPAPVEAVVADWFVARMKGERK